MTKEELIVAFTILECELGCSADEVKSSYRQLVKVWHPDRFDSDSKLKLKATEKMKLINEAYRLLTRFFDELERQQSAEQPEPKTDNTNQTSAKAGESVLPTVDSLVEPQVIHKFPHSEWGSNGANNIFFVKNLIEFLEFDGEIISSRTAAFRTKSVVKEVNYQTAASGSMAFSRNLDQAKKSYVPLPDGLPDWRANFCWTSGSYDCDVFSFPDGSDVWFLKSKTKLVLLDGKINWKKNRTGLESIEEDFQISKNRNNWKTCVLLGQKGIDLHEENPWGWIKRAFAMHCLSKTESALWGLKHRAVKLFPSNTTINYNLACYSSCLGDTKEAKNWLKAAFKFARKDGSFNRYNQMALEDSDLSAIRAAIPQLALFSSVSRFF